MDDSDDEYQGSDISLPDAAAITDRPKRDKGKGKAVGNEGNAGSAAAKAKAKAKRSKTGYESKDGQGYAWEEEYKRSWDVLREDESGSLESAVNEFMQNAKRKRVLRDTTSIQRGIIRHLFLVIDLSLAMADRDLRPSRLELTLTYAQEFVTEFFDQNPISQMCILVTKDGIAERLSALSGNPVDHHKALTNKRKLDPSGEPSLQNALEMARAGLSHLPTHGSREVLVIFGSLTTCDPGNIHQTIEALEKDRVRVSIVGLSAEISICKEICKRTKGNYGVVINETHFKDLIFEAVPPPPTLSTSRPAATTGSAPAQTTNTSSADLMLMGFPTLLSTPHSSLCSCHAKLKQNGFLCPRCESRLCDVPTDCGVCGLTVVSSPHLARSYRHLFPVGNWIEADGPFENPYSLSLKCFGCALPFPALPQRTTTGAAAALPADTVNQGGGASKGNAGAAVQGRVSQTGRYECPRCHNHFCLDCDVFHEGLGICPGCC